MSTTTGHPYITTNPLILSGEPIVEGTRTSVRAIVEMWRRGVGPEEILSRLPHLKVFDALSYYSDHQDEIHTYIRCNEVPDEIIASSEQDQGIGCLLNFTWTRMSMC